MLRANMFSQLRYRIGQGSQILALGCGVAASISMATVLGGFQGLELRVLDHLLQWRQGSRQLDERILVVTIDESDIEQVGQWPLPDAVMAELVRRLRVHEPAGIGIDIFRNIPVAPGTDELEKVFSTTPNVFGVEKVVGDAVPPNSTLAALGQTAAADLVVDSDGRVRRGLLTILTEDGSVHNGLATKLALHYLEAQGIYPESLDDENSRIHLGKTTIKRFEQYDGSYAGENDGGYQVLMNYQGSHQRFESVSLSAVLAGEVPAETIRDRVIFLGSTAPSLNDYFNTPIEGAAQVAGVYIHAHLLSQLLSAALDGRSLLKTVPNGLEFLWTLGWVGVSVLTTRSFFYSRSLTSKLSVKQLAFRLVGVFLGLGFAGYGLLLLNWWLPIVLPATSIAASAAVGFVYRNQQLQNLAAFDELTQVANRRYFDQYLAEALKSQKNLSLLLCDVDHFKAYNDLYGHPAGDRCLQQVAQAIRLAIRDSDLVARYGGEEFVIVLPGASDEVAMGVANRIQYQVYQMRLPHEGSSVSDFVSLSCGAATVVPGVELSPLRLVEYADQALYQAKQAGRNQIILSQWHTALPDTKSQMLAGLPDEGAA